jgi:hypothetical protein
MLKDSCLYHKGLVKHTLGECDMLRRFYNKPGPSTEGGNRKAPDAGDDDDDKGDGFPSVHNYYMIFWGDTINMSSRQRKQEHREVFSVEAVTSVYLDWSDRAITFNWDDHLDHVPNPRKYPLIVDPIISNRHLTKVLMDGGSSLNIIYADTLDLLGVGRSQIRPGAAPFHGIIPGKRVHPLGQAIPWPQSYKPPQLPMYDGHSDPKQFLMSYEATISSYGGNAAVMAKSFVMAVRCVAQTWYSSLRPGTITSWQKLKDMLVTSFQVFQTKPVTTQALFQCTQDHEEYLQAYVRRFLRLRAQAPTIPNEIVIEAMIKGLRPRPTAQYFARKPTQTLEKLLQKMDEYIRAENDFRQRREEAYRFFEMTRGFGGRIHPRHVKSIHSSSQNNDKGSQFQRPQHSSQSSGQQQSSFRPPAPRDRGGRDFGGRYGDQPRKIYCLFCGEDKGHTTRTCQITIQKQKGIAEAEAR